MTDNKYLVNQSIISGKRKESIALNIPLYPDDIDSCSSEKNFLVIEDPLRGIWMGGNMNEEKRRFLITPIAEQMTDKGWNMCICDHYFPLLTEKLHSFRPGTIFHTVNFGDAMHSDRVNLLRYVKDKLDAIQMAETIVSILYKGQPAFFSQAIIQFMAACIWLFCHEGQYSFPHVLAFLMEKYETIIHILMNHSECMAFMKHFKAAYNRKDFGQIEGMVSEFRVKLARWCTYQTFWIGSEEEFPLQIRKPLSRNAEILLIATGVDNKQDDTVTTEMGTLLLNTFLAVNSTIDNATLPLGVVVDDMKDVFIHDLDRLFGTMRYLKIALALGFQTERQLEREYGDRVRDVLFPIIPTFLSTSIQHTGTVGWLRKFDVLKKNKDIPEGYVYYLQGTKNDLVKVNTAETSKGIPLKTPPRFTDEEEMNGVLKKNYNRIVSEVKNFCKNRICSNKREK